MSEQLLAEVGADGIIRRVIVCDSVAWATQNLGGTWVPTYTDRPAEKYAGPGDGFDPKASRRFATPWSKGQSGPVFSGGKIIDAAEAAAAEAVLGSTVNE